MTHSAVTVISISHAITKVNSLTLTGPSLTHSHLTGPSTHTHWSVTHTRVLAIRAIAGFFEWRIPQRPSDWLLRRGPSACAQRDALTIPIGIVFHGIVR